MSEVMISHNERFNGYDPGAVRPAAKADAKKWEGMGLCKIMSEAEVKAHQKAKAEAAKTEDEPEQAKAEDGPPVNKAIKEPAKKK